MEEETHCPNHLTRLVCPNCGKVYCIEMGEYPWTWQAIHCEDCGTNFISEVKDNELH